MDDDGIREIGMGERTISSMCDMRSLKSMNASSASKWVYSLK